jgi:glycine/D-amino acid oxidase-like deaminating enzyme
MSLEEAAAECAARSRKIGGRAATVAYDDAIACSHIPRPAPREGMSGRLLVSSTTLAAAALSTVTYFASHSRVAHTKTASPPPASTLRPIPCRDGTLVFPFSFPSREANLRRLEKEHFDVLVIGGGCVGAGVALDASLRGLKVAVVDADDFASGTSGRSTKLIHGGVRYLENAFWHLDLGEYRLVREALHERRHMLHAAPHMARALPIMVPLEAWWQVPYFWAGTKVYDFVAGKNSGVPPSMFMSREQALFAFPMLNPDRLKGAVVYYDGQMNDTRYALSVLLTAVQAGAAAGNYCRVQGLGTNAEGKITSAMCRDAISGREFEIKARAVVNATGPFSDSIRHMAENASRKAKVRAWMGRWAEGRLTPPLLLQQGPAAAPRGVAAPGPDRAGRRGARGAARPLQPAAHGAHRAAHLGRPRALLSAVGGRHLVRHYGQQDGPHHDAQAQPGGD